MQKKKDFNRVRFLPEQIVEIAGAFRSRLDKRLQGTNPKLSVTLTSEEWEHERESEFFSDIRRDAHNWTYRILPLPHDLIIRFNVQYGATVIVNLPSREDIEAVFHVAEKLAPLAKMPEAERSDDDEAGPTIFIGHGNSPLWRDLKDHLQDHHNFVVEAYEVGARAGHAIRDILEEMLESSSIAFLVMTGEDTTADGLQRARQNVVHEIGLFQGRLGFSRAIVLMEEGVEEFSNIHGIQQIRFQKGAIRETFGDVLATVYREFPDAA